MFIFMTMMMMMMMCSHHKLSLLFPLLLYWNCLSRSLRLRYPGCILRFRSNVDVLSELVVRNLRRLSGDDRVQEPILHVVRVSRAGSLPRVCSGTGSAGYFL